MKNKKSLESRQKEINDMKKKLSDLGITSEIEGISEFYKRLKDFEDGYSSSGVINLYGYKRRLEFKLSMNMSINSTLVLRYDDNI